ncbi:MAG: ATP-binding protein [Desulfobulbaceae bacterium]|nr:ATP-binding protein [Desulfobulbaceae bacterium]HIJ78872.1 PAS domain S-box protein [Deltaproteobacteria bacterium]
MKSSKICPNTGSPAANNQLKKQIQWLLFLRVIFLSLLLGVSVLLQSEEKVILLPPIHFVAYFIAGLYLFTIASALILRKILCYSRFGFMQISLDTLLISGLIFFTGGSQSVFTGVYFFPIVMGALLLLRQGGFLFAALSTLFYGGLLLLEFRGYGSSFLLPSPSPSPLVNIQAAMQLFAIHGLTFFLVALLSSMLAKRLQTTEAALVKTTYEYDHLSLLYKQIFDDINTGIITVDDNYLITSFNPAAEAITGFETVEVIGRSIAKIFPGLVPIAQPAERPIANLTRKDGATIPVGYSWAKLNTPDGSDNARIYTMQDLSEIKKMEAKVQQAEKMATIGEMAAGIAHELRNPLAAISGAAQILRKDEQENPTNSRLLNIINRECERLALTIQEFLLFSKPAPPEIHWFSLKKLVVEAVELTEQNPKWNSSIKIEMDIADSLDCWADHQLLKQVLLNLISNSANACSAASNATIKIMAREQSSQKNENDTIMIQVRDNGTGIEEKVRRNIFEPFFTTRENGTGLGLAIVKQIVESHGGMIEVENDESRGAIFTITLPLP